MPYTFCTKVTLKIEEFGLSRRNNIGERLSPDKPLEKRPWFRNGLILMRGTSY